MVAPDPPQHLASQQHPRPEAPVPPSPWAVAAAVVPPSPAGGRVVPITGRGAVAAYVTAAVPLLVVRWSAASCSGRPSSPSRGGGGGADGRREGSGEERGGAVNGRVPRGPWAKGVGHGEQ